MHEYKKPIQTAAGLSYIKYMEKHFLLANKIELDFHQRHR